MIVAILICHLFAYLILTLYEPGVEKKNCDDHVHISIKNPSCHGRPLQRHDGDSVKKEANEGIEGMTVIGFQGMQKDVAMYNIRPKPDRDAQRTNTSNHLHNPLLLLFLRHLLFIVSELPSKADPNCSNVGKLF